MSKTKTPALSQQPLSGGDYIDNGDGPKRTAPSTAPPVGKSAKKEAEASAKPAASPTDTAASK